MLDRNFERGSKFNQSFILLISTFQPFFFILYVYSGECGERPADVIFIMDSSGSISAADFQRQLRFVGDVINEFFIGADHTRVGAVSFSNWAFLDFYLDTYTDQGSIQAALGKIKQVRGDTNTPSAISYTRDVMFTATHGARQNVSHIAIIMTDGKSNEPKVTAKEAAKMRMYGIHVFAVGIGNGVDMEELHALATPPTVNNVFHVDDYIALPTIKDKLAIKTCGGNIIPSLSGKIRKNLGPIICGT